MNSLSKAIAHCRLHSSGPWISTLFKYHASTSAAGEIVIPRRIPRGPTDILKALSETIKRDPTAPDFKFQDDPYLTPTSAPQKRSYSLSYESGRKAARWVRDEHPDLFQQVIADPAVEAYKPYPKITEQTPVTEETLVEMIQKVNVTHAIQVFENLRNSGKAISGDTLQSLLELVCFYNCVEPVPEEDVEERWYSREEQAKTYSQWKGDIPQKIFDLIENPGTAAYSALICGMARYGEFLRVDELLEECKTAGIPLDVKVYNQLILSTRNRFGVLEKRWQLINHYLNEIKRGNIAPNIQMFNSVIESAIGGTVSPKKIACAFMALGEIRALGMKPSLATYKSLLYCLQYGGFYENQILKDILDEIGDEPLEIVDKRDSQFFVHAMSACLYMYKDLALARRLDDLLNRNAHNKSFIGNSIAEAIYYRCYLLLLCEKAPLHEVFATFKTLVPNLYSPEPAVVTELLNVVKKNNKPEFVKDIYDFACGAAQLGQQRLSETLVETCVHVGGGPNREKYASYFAQIADQIMDLLSNPWTVNLAGRLILSETLAGASLVLLARDLRVEDVKVLIDLFQTNARGSTIDAKYLTELADIGIEMKDPDIVLWVIQLASPLNSVPIKPVIVKLYGTMEVPRAIEMVLSQIVGEEWLKTIKSTNPVGLPDDSASSGSSESSSSSSSGSESDDESGSDDELGIKK